MLHEDVKYRATVIVTSDTCARDPFKDTSGRYVTDRLVKLGLFTNVTKLIVEDDKQSITKITKKTIADTNNILIITVGGTGLCPRDVTPEATSVLYEKYCSGIATALHMTSLRYSPHAALSRLTAGIVGECLIVNFPGSQKACEQSLTCLEGFLEHALEQVKFNAEAIEATHKRQQQPQQIHVDNSSHINQHETTDSQQTPEASKILEILLKKDTQSRITFEDQPSCFYSPASAANSPWRELLSNLSEASNRGNDDDSFQHLDSMVLSPQDKCLSPNQPLGLTIRQTQKYESDPSSQPPIGSELADRSSNEKSSPSSSSGSIKHDTESVAKPMIKESPYPLVEYTKALAILGGMSSNLCINIVDIELNSFSAAQSLLGDILACDVKSSGLIPSYSVSTMDGYVLNIPEMMKKMIELIRTFKAKLVKDLKEFERMQNDPTQKSNFFCYQVNTGGRLPANNFAVIPVETTETVPSSNIVTIYSVKSNQYIRPAGSDLVPDDVIKTYSRIGPIELGLIFSMGVKRLKVFKKPVLSVLSTGDELREIFSPESDSSIVDSNAIMLTTTLTKKGYDVTYLGIAHDSIEEIMLKMNEGLEQSDILLVTGGASMGSKDYVKDAAIKMGAEIHFGRVNMKPGKPVAFMSLSFFGKQKFIFSLPGNPVSAYITSLVLVIPFIEGRMRNHITTDQTTLLDCLGDKIQVEIAQILDQKEDQCYEFDGRFEFVRANLLDEVNADKTLKAAVSIKQQSSRLLNLRHCNCLLVILPDKKGLKLEVGQKYPALKLTN